MLIVKIYFTAPGAAASCTDMNFVQHSNPVSSSLEIQEILEILEIQEIQGR
jgi:hypothetical protein